MCVHVCVRVCCVGEGVLCSVSIRSSCFAMVCPDQPADQVSDSYCWRGAQSVLDGLWAGNLLQKYQRMFAITAHILQFD